MDTAQYLRARAEQVERELDRQLPPAESPPGRIHEAMRYAVFGGGKRLRPVLCLAACEAAGGRAEEALPAAAALEMIHTYSLVHDDLPSMDDDDLRRGRPTCHRVYGEGMAILVGDALLSQAFLTLGRWAVSWRDPAAAAELIAEIAEAVGSKGMVGGQALDIEGHPARAGAAELERVHRLKTGALFRASVRAGGRVAGAASETLAALAAYADHFGLAFQIHDDVLDAVGEAAAMGKPAGSDERNRRFTYVSAVGIERAREMARRAAEAAVAAASRFGVAGEPLAALARLAVDRDR